MPHQVKRGKDSFVDADEMEPPMAMTHDTIASEIDDIAKGSA